MNVKVKIHKNESKIAQHVGNTIVVIVRSQQMNSKIDIRIQLINIIPVQNSEVEEVKRQHVAAISAITQIINIEIKQKIIL